MGRVGSDPTSEGGVRRQLELNPRLFGRDSFDVDLIAYMGDVISRRVFPYAEIPASKPTGGCRTLHSPEPRLMALQRAALDGALSHVAPHPTAFAYRSGVSTLDCANVHLRARTVIRLDIASFFTSIRERHVFDALVSGPRGAGGTGADLALSGLAAYELTCLLTVSGDPATWPNRGTGARRTPHGRKIERRYKYTGQREGHLPQGAPTSGALSNLVMRDADEQIYQFATSNGLRYTRYSDDMYFSSRRSISRSTVESLIAHVRSIVAVLGLRLNDRKTFVAGPGARRSVLGIIVDGPTPRLPQDYKRKVQLHLRGVRTFGLHEHATHREFDSAEQLDHYVTGLLAYGRMVEPAWAAPLWETWQRLRALPAADGAQHAPGQPDLFSQAGSSNGSPHGAAIAKASIDELIRGAHRYRRTEEYVKLLEFVGRFKQYAPFNAMLVDLQRPGARYVLTAERWRREFRRALKPGAQPLVILQPMGPYMVVYDVGDTEALPGARALPREVVDPLAISACVSDAAVMKLWDRTVDNAVRDGIRVTLVDHGAHAAGKTYRTRSGGVLTRPAPRSNGPDERHPLRLEIEVNRNLAPLDRYATLVHELAHQYCGHLGTTNPDHWPDRPNGTKQRNEVEAESITYMVVARLDPRVKMGDYILAHARTNAQTPSDIALNLMFKVAGDIAAMGQQRLPFRKAKA